MIPGSNADDVDPTQRTLLLAGEPPRHVIRR